MGTKYDASVEALLQTKDYGATPTNADMRSVFEGLVTSDWRMALIARGYGWHIDTVAAFATPITGGGGSTVIDLDQPEFGISVPTGFALIPLRIQVSVNIGVLTTDNHIAETCILLDRVAEYALGGGTVVAETPVNLRSTPNAGCPATCFSAGTENITAPTMSAILAAATKRGNFGDNTGMSLESVDLLYEPKRPPIVIGPGAIYGYFGGSVAVTGYATADFLVIPSALCKDLV